jgi:hypothetical protein
LFIIYIQHVRGRLVGIWPTSTFCISLLYSIYEYIVSIYLSDLLWARSLHPWVLELLLVCHPHYWAMLTRVYDVRRSIVLFDTFRNPLQQSFRFARKHKTFKLLRSIGFLIILPNLTILN